MEFKELHGCTLHSALSYVKQIAYIISHCMEFPLSSAVTDQLFPGRIRKPCYINKLNLKPNSEVKRQ